MKHYVYTDPSKNEPIVKRGEGQTPEQIEKRAAAHRGIPRSACTIEAIKRAQTGLKRSEETKAKLRAAWERRRG